MYTDKKGSFGGFYLMYKVFGCLGGELKRLLMLMNSAARARIEWREGDRGCSPLICLQFLFFQSIQQENAKSVLHGMLINKMNLEVRFF